MKSIFRCSFLVALASFALIITLLGNTTVASAQSAASLDKHSRKIERKLSKFKSGRYLHIVFSDDTNAYGALGNLNDATFTFTSSDNNATATYQYASVDRINTDQERIGEGTEPHHFRHLVPIAITAAAIAAGALTYEAVR